MGNEAKVTEASTPEPNQGSRYGLTPPPPADTPPEGAGGSAGPESGGESKPPEGGMNDADVFSQFASRWLGEKVKPAKPKPEKSPGGGQKTDEGGGEPAPEATEKPPKSSKSSKAKPKQDAAAPPEPNYEKIAEATARGTAEALAKLQLKPGESQSQKPEPQLPEAEQRKIETLKVLEELYPDKYKGISEKYREGIIAGMEYAKKWQEENPDEEFDESDPEHEDFFKKHDVHWEDEDYLEALAEVKLRAKLPEVEGKLSGKVQKIERMEKLRELAPVIDKHQAAAAKLFFDSLDPELGKIIRPDGTVDHELLRHFSEQNPVLTSIAVGHFAQNVVEPLAAEVFKLYQGLTDFDQNRQDHRFLNEFVLRCEREISALPAEKQRDNQGRSFLPAADYYKLPPQKREQYWTLSYADVTPMLADAIARDAQKIVEQETQKYRSWAKMQKLPLGDAPEAEASRDNAFGQSRRTDKPESPETVVAPKLAPASQRGSAESTNPQIAFIRRFLG